MVAASARLASSHTLAARCFISACTRWYCLSAARCSASSAWARRLACPPPSTRQRGQPPSLLLLPPPRLSSAPSSSGFFGRNASHAPGLGGAHLHSDLGMPLRREPRVPYHGTRAPWRRRTASLDGNADTDGDTGADGCGKRANGGG